MCNRCVSEPQARVEEALSRKPRNRPQIQTEKENAMFVEEGKEEVKNQSSQEEKEEETASVRWV